MSNVFDFSQYYNNIAAISDSGEKLTYKELEDYGNEIYSNINKRTLAFVLCSNTIECLTGFTSFINNRVVSILIGSNIDIQLLNKLIEIYKPEYIWLPKNRINEIEYKEVYSFKSYSLLYTKFETPKLYDELALLITTSGSTGSPKFVRLSYSNLEIGANQVISCNRIYDSTQKTMITLQMNYIYAVVTIYIRLLIGGTMLLTDKNITQKSFWDFFKKEGSATFEGVPFMYEILEKIGFYQMEISTLKYMTQSGGKLSTELHKKIATFARDRGIAFYPMYGATEAAGVMTSLPSEESLNKIGSIGKVVQGSNLYVIDDDNCIINSPNIEGELIYKGPNVSLGYAQRREDLLKADERFGELATGDVGYFDEDGYFFITGRKKRFLKVYGHRISLDEIDQIVKEEFGNIEFVSSGVDNCIYLFTTKKGLEQNIKKFIANKTKLPIIAFKSMTINEIPRNESGKVMFKELKRYYQQ